MRWSVVRVGTKDHCKDSAFTLNEKGSYWRVLNKGIPSLIIFKTSIQEVTYIQTFKLWTFKDANLCSINVWRGETAACPGLSLMTLQLYRPPPPRSPPLRSPSCLFTQGQPLDAGCFPTLLYFSRHRAIRLNTFSLFLCLFLCIICMRRRRKWQPTPVFLPRESHGQRSLAGRGPWGCRESDTTEVTEHIICMRSIINLL